MHETGWNCNPMDTLKSSMQEIRKSIENLLFFLKHDSDIYIYDWNVSRLKTK